MEQNGFTQDQLVIYKLGQIESQLAAFLVKMAENKADYSKLNDRISNLEDFLNTMKNRFIGSAAIISFIVVSAKVVITWLN